MAKIQRILEQHGIDTTTLRRVELRLGASFYAFAIPNGAALTRWAALRDLVAETGHWPLLIGDETSASELLPAIFDGTATQAPLWEEGFDAADTAATIAAGLQIDPIAWVDEKYRTSPNYRRERWEEEPEEGHDFEYHERRGQIFSLPTETLYGTPSTDVSLSPVYLILLPVSEGWQVPAFLQYGGVNDCPQPEEHVAMLRWWHERYGAELVWLFTDSVYLRIVRPPCDPTVARGLAREQLVYCSSIEAASTIESLAGLLNRATVWYFWWD